MHSLSAAFQCLICTLYVCANVSSATLCSTNNTNLNSNTNANIEQHWSVRFFHITPVPCNTDRVYWSIWRRMMIITINNSQSVTLWIIMRCCICCADDYESRLADKKRNGRVEKCGRKTVNAIENRQWMQSKFESSQQEKCFDHQLMQVNIIVLAKFDKN